MAAFVFDVAFGKVARYCELPLASDVMRWALYQASGIEADTVLKRKLTVADLVTGTTREATFTGYDQTNHGLAASAAGNTSPFTAGSFVYVDNTGVGTPPAGDQVKCDADDPTWNPTTGQALAKIVLYYDPDGTHTLANCVPLFCDDFLLTTPTSGSITYQVASGGFYSAAAT